MILAVLGAGALPFILAQARLPARLASAEIDLTVQGAEVLVEARYVVDQDGPWDLLGLKVRDQVVTVEQSSQDGRPLVVEQGPASIRLRASGAAAVRVRYRLTGSLGRVPVFVPSIPTRPPGRTVRIVVSGLEAHRVTRFTVPRFRSDGSRWVAELEHVPSLVAVIRDQSDRPVPLVAELVVLLVAVGGTGYWLARLARTRPSHAGARA